MTQPLTEVVIWSQFGLYRTMPIKELMLNECLDKTAAEVLLDLEQFGFSNTFCDVERVSVLPCYPEDCEPAEVLAWIEEGKWEPEA